MSEFSIVGVEPLPRIGFLSAECRTIKCPNGQIVDRIAIAHPGAVAVVPVDGDNIVMIRQYRAALDEWLLEIPAGKRDVPGEDTEVTARRELYEELGITGCRLRPGISFVNAPGYSDEVIDILVAEHLEFGSGPHPDGPEEEFALIERLPRSEIAGAIARGDIRDAKSIIGLQLLS